MAPRCFVTALLLLIATPAFAQESAPTAPSPQRADPEPEVAPLPPAAAPPPVAPSGPPVPEPAKAAAVPADDAPEPPQRSHAPKYSFWVGARPSFLVLGGNFYDNERNKLETTGNLIRNGLGLEINLGARIAKRYIPYFAYERGVHGQGHRFEGSDASATSEFVGAGVRVLLGDADEVSFLTDLAFGNRTFTISRGADSYSMRTLEYFRVGLGAEIRLSTRFVLSPTAYLSSGTMQDSEGTVLFSQKGSADGLMRPRYTEGESITTARGYVVFAIGCGVHFDLFGK